MSGNPKAAFFDGIAGKWDGWEDLPALARRLDAGLRELALGENEAVLDVGCGTGNLTRALLDRLSPAGRVVAVDFAPQMIAAARRKVCDARVDWRTEEVLHLSLEDGAVDRVICYSVWPHFEDPAAAIRELRRVLRVGGRLHIWHLIGREQVNAVHATAGEAVRGDVLPPAEETARLLIGFGFAVTATVDSPEQYLVTAVKHER